MFSPNGKKIAYDRTTNDFTADGEIYLMNADETGKGNLRLNNQTSDHHLGGAIDFGKDGKLYIASGDNQTPTKVQQITNLFGKMLRTNKDGTLPTDNPFYSKTSGNNRAIWALGLRNPFKFAIQPGTDTIFINDVGRMPGRR